MLAIRLNEKCTNSWRGTQL